jgi:MEDS: MEthanogen/methylotroph, DcmR Sensory domain
MAATGSDSADNRENVRSSCLQNHRGIAMNDSESVALGALGLRFPRGTHVCAFYSGSPGRDEIVLPFLAEGIRAGDQCLCFLDTAAPSEVLSQLALQVDVNSPVATGQLQVATPAESYLRTGRFVADEMIDYWGEAAAHAQRGGDFSFIRATGDLPLELSQPAERAEFVRYEARLNEVIPNYPQLILCLYDMERFGATVLMDALRTHRRVIADGMVHDNPYYIEPDKFLARRT